MEKLGKGLIAFMIFIFMAFFAGCGAGERSGDMQTAEEKQQKLV